MEIDFESVLSLNYLMQPFIVPTHMKKVCSTGLFHISLILTLQQAGEKTFHHLQVLQNQPTLLRSPKFLQSNCHWCALQECHMHLLDEDSRATYVFAISYINNTSAQNHRTVVLPMPLSHSRFSPSTLVARQVQKQQQEMVSSHLTCRSAGWVVFLT